MIGSILISISLLSMDLHSATAKAHQLSEQQPFTYAVAFSERGNEDEAANRETSSAMTVGITESGERRGQPRISQTRCALVICGMQCDIKGSREANGELIYRTPTSPHYKPAAAERIFCSQADAKAAGYRAEKQR
jgi:hypothetical protein